MREKLLRFLIKIILPSYHLARTGKGTGRRKKPLDPVIDPNSGAKGDV